MALEVLTVQEDLHMVLVDLHMDLTVVLVDPHLPLYNLEPHPQDPTPHPPHLQLMDLLVDLHHPPLQVLDPQVQHHHQTPWLHPTSHLQPRLLSQDPQEPRLPILDHRILHLHTILHLTLPTQEDLQQDTQEDIHQAILQPPSQTIQDIPHTQRQVDLQQDIHLLAAILHNKEDTKDMDTMATLLDLDHLTVLLEVPHKVQVVHLTAAVMEDKDLQDIHQVILDIPHKDQVDLMEVPQHQALAHLRILPTKVDLPLPMMDLVDRDLPMDLHQHRSIMLCQSFNIFFILIIL